MGRPPSPTHLNHLPTATQAPQHRVSVPIPHPAAAGLIPEFLDPSRTWPPTGHPAGGRISGGNTGGGEIRPEIRSMNEQVGKRI